jgi:transposase
LQQNNPQAGRFLQSGKLGGREFLWEFRNFRIVHGRRSGAAKGFEVLPRRWVVERTFAWLGRCRRLAKDFENRSHNALAFLKLASIRLMLRRLCSK